MRIRRGGVLSVAVAVLALAVAACGPSGGSGSGGTVSVLYAGSLVSMMENELGPEFSKATGYGYEGYGGGSTEVAQQIKSKVRRGDVFISASSSADESIEGGANGEWVNWYSTFAEAPLVIGYNPDSSYAEAFKSKPWYEVIGEPGIKVGRTDPKLDPKGEKTVAAIEEAATKLRMPELEQTLDGFPVFPEEALVGRLQSGQLDAGFFYENEAVEAHVPVVPIKPAEQVAAYTVTILEDAPNPSGAEAFVRYLLGPAGSATLKRYGLTVLEPQLSGEAAAVPSGLRQVVGAG